MQIGLLSQKSMLSKVSQHVPSTVDSIPNWCYFHIYHTHWLPFTLTCWTHVPAQTAHHNTTASLSYWPHVVDMQNCFNKCDDWCFLLLLFNMSLLLFLVQRFFDIWELVVSTSWVVSSQWDSSLFLDFLAINHGEINKVLLVVFSSFIITCLNIVHVYTVQ